MNEEGPKIPEPDADFENKEKINLRILVADDSERMRNLLKGLLEENYSYVKVVENGQQLLDELAALGQNYDIVVTDNNMPVKSGIEVLKEIRSKDELKHIQVIVLTADPLPDTESIIEASGGIYMSKPFSEEELLKKINELTQKS